MGLQNIFILTLMSLYVLLFILSFFICIPAGVSVSDYDGHCLLYTSGKWEISGPQPKLVDVHWGNDSACNFTIFIGVISLMLSLFYSIWTSVLLVRGFTSSWLDAFLNLIVNSIMCICIFSTALTVSVGFRDWCNLITDPKSGIDKCEDGQYISMWTSGDFHNINYFTQWQVAQFGVWSSWIVWLILSVMSLIRMYRYHRQEAFAVSINRERQRLLQKVGHGTEQA